MNRRSTLLTQARDIAGSVKTWADLSNALFDPETGLISRAYPTREGRAAFLRTEEYAKIRSLVNAATERTGLIEGAMPKEKSGKFVVRIPKSLHFALEREAEKENVSLNQLVVVKLAAQLSEIASGTHPELAAVAQAFLEVRDGYSADRVIADPEMNRLFLHRCRELGLAGTDFELNWKLMYARKNRYLGRLPKTRKYTPSHIDEFEFSSEIAVRYVQRLTEPKNDRIVSLDKILCDPELAEKFDEIAMKLAPGFSRLDYRWTALGIRKAAGRYWQDAMKMELPCFDVLGSTKSVRAGRIPTGQGIYLFRCEDDALFVGETNNLRHRIEQHFDQSETKGVPDWLYDSGRKAVSLGIVSLPAIEHTNRKLLELRTIASLHPIFNLIASKSNAA